MRHQRLAASTVCSLLLLGAICCTARWQARRTARLTNGDAVWELECETVIEAERGGQALLPMPAGTAWARVYEQALHHPGLAVEPVRMRADNGLRLRTTALEAGTHTLRARYGVVVGRLPLWAPPAPPPALKSTQRTDCLRATTAIQVTAPAVRETLAAIRRDRKLTKRPLAEALFAYCSDELAEMDRVAPSDAAATLSELSGTRLGRARAMVALCRAAGIPARIVGGLILREAPAATIHHWVELWLGKQWLPFDLHHGYAGDLPPHFLPLFRGAETSRGGAEQVRTLHTRYAVTAAPPGQGPAAPPPGTADLLDLRRLPADSRHAVGLMLLLPFGALVVALLRNVVGIQTFGTFAPVLLAVSMVDSDWRLGIAVLAMLLIVAAVGRWLIEPLRLLLVPRLGLILCLVVVFVTGAVAVVDRLGWSAGGRAVLLPLVIVTMLCERFHVACEEDGWAHSLWLLAQTAAAALCCYLILARHGLSRIVVSYPELHFFSAACFVVIGRYTGYRITELWRFRELTVSPPVTHKELDRDPSPY